MEHNEKMEQHEETEQNDHFKIRRVCLKEMEEKIFSVRHSGDATTESSDPDPDPDPDPEKSETKMEESFPLSSKPSSCYTQFPKDLLHQLSHNEKFESQHLKCEVMKNKAMNVRKDEEEARSKRSSSVPAISRRLTKQKNPRTFELFNPNYNEKKENLGKSLLESIRTKVFGFSLEREDTDDEWKCHSNQSSDTTLRLPKETRNAMTYSEKTPRFCVSCSRLIKNVKTIDAQTSPIVSTTQMFVALAPPAIPCTLNLLCDKGIHLGRCEEAIREKLQEPVCGEDCVCRCEDSEEAPNLVDQEPSTSSSTMNGLNGHTNGDLNGCGDIITQNQQKGCWTIGLINSKFRYLTAETFGFKINANGASLKKKQIWTLEPEGSNGDSLIYLRSHLDKYLAVDSFGNVTCESEEKDPGCVFQISVSEDGTGRWALKNVVRGYFLGSTSDKLTCTAKVPGDAEFWHIHLAARPQVNLRSVGRKRFAHLSENLDEIHVDANIPWGEDTLFTLEFRLDESGKYAIHTCNNKYLSMGGKLVESCGKDCLFSAEYHSGQLALRDRTGAYLSPIGSKAVLKTRSNTVTKDELFSLEDSLPQASFVASLNSRFVSVKQGVDVTANQDEISDHETFQLEFDWSTKRWYIRTMQDRYWTLETGGGIQASGDKRSSNALFDLVWQGDGSLAFRANNGRYVITKRSGHLYATADTIDDNCKYFFYLINRPILVLKCEQGFVGYKSASSPKLECNKATYECIQVERGEKGIVYFKGQNGKYWHVDTEGVTADSDSQEGFYLELREPTRLCIKSQNGNYLTASKNGLFRLGDTNIENATQWEY